MVCPPQWEIIFPSCLAISACTSRMGASPITITNHSITHHYGQGHVPMSPASSFRLIEAPTSHGKRGKSGMSFLSAPYIPSIARNDFRVLG